MLGSVPEQGYSADHQFANAARESRSLDRLYRDEAPRLLRFLHRRTDDRDTAHDLLQDAFARLAGIRRSELIQPRAYLNRIVRNLLADRGRSAKVRPKLVEIDPDMEIVGHDPLAQLESRDMLRRLEIAMDRLKPRTREIFMAHRLDGRSFAEIAGITGLSVKGVEKQMAKAIAQIDRMLDRS